MIEYHNKKSPVLTMYGVSTGGLLSYLNWIWMDKT